MIDVLPSAGAGAGERICIATPLCHPGTSPLGVDPETQAVALAQLKHQLRTALEQVEAREEAMRAGLEKQG